VVVGAVAVVAAALALGARGPAPSAPGVALAPPALGVGEFLAGWAAPEGTERDPTTGYPRRIRRTADNAAMVLIPAGAFRRGAVAGDPLAGFDETPARVVTLTRAYYLDEHEVTITQWAAYARAKGVPMPPLHRTATDNAMPVHEVSWGAVQGFLAWAGVSLPTEAQWERAARGGDEDAIYPWGRTDVVRARNADDLDDGVHWFAPVRSFPPNPYGLYDIAGNVWEWCADRYQSSYYAAAPSVDPLGPPDGPSRVVRGGGLGSTARDLRASHRYSQPEDGPLDVYVGFRAAKTVP
jgi:formylglycine-generating enzyme required for sulfatase activity